MDDPSVMADVMLAQHGCEGALVAAAGHGKGDVVRVMLSRGQQRRHTPNTSGLGPGPGAAGAPDLRVMLSREQQRRHMPDTSGAGSGPGAAGAPDLRVMRVPVSAAENALVRAAEEGHVPWCNSCSTGRTLSSLPTPTAREAAR